MIDSRRHSGSVSTHARVMDMMEALDAVLLRLPPDPDDWMVNEVERIVITLRTADEHIVNKNSTGALQFLDLARARLGRFVDRLDPDGASPSTKA